MTILRRRLENDSHTLTESQTPVGVGRILLIISGGISAYKSLELIRRLRDSGYEIRTILTAAGAEFVTPLSIASLSESPVHQELLSLTSESEMGHIELSRWADLVVVAPATADLMAKMAMGMANDLASTTLLASNRPILIAPAMNHYMWQHPATQSNLALLTSRGVAIVGPNGGDLACGEVGQGRMAEVGEIITAITSFIGANQPLSGKKFIVTNGATREAIDPVRFISNHSSGRQGTEIAHALIAAGAEVILVNANSSEPPPPRASLIKVTSAAEILAACLNNLPADGAICVAAVADWRVENPAKTKQKKQANQSTLTLTLVENADILATLAQHRSRPELVIGFAAETEDLLKNATAKRQKKQCDWIVANLVGDGIVFAQDTNQATIIDSFGPEAWPSMTKSELARRLVQRIIDHFQKPPRQVKP